MFLYSSNIGLSLLIYISIMAFFIYTKPAFLYDHERNKFKEFRTGSDGTIFPIWGIAIFMGIFSYLLSTFLLNLFQKNTSNNIQQHNVIQQQIPMMNYQQPLNPFLNQMSGGGIDMCTLGSCFPPQNMMYGGYQKNFNIPASKVWKNL